jgi:hypothetical protein
MIIGCLKILTQEYLSFPHDLGGNPDSAFWTPDRNISQRDPFPVPKEWLRQRDSPKESFGPSERDGSDTNF